jgi:hypothetical protein
MLSLLLQLPTQVPLTLCRLCKQALLEMPESSALFAAAALLRVLFNGGALAHVLEEGTDLALSTQQQVQDSGILQHLPTLFATAAAQLPAAVAYTAGSTEGMNDHLDKMLFGSAFVRDALALQAGLLETWVAQEGSLVLADLCLSSSAMLPFIFTSIQWVSRDVQHMLQLQRQGRQQGDDRTVWLGGQLREMQADVLNCAERCVQRLAFLIADLRRTPDVQLRQEVQSMLLSADLLRCLVAIIAVVASRETRDTQRDALSSSSSRSGGSSNTARSSSSSSGFSMPRGTAAGSTQQQRGLAGVNSGCGQQDGQPQLRMTPSNARLVQLLGLNADALDWIEHECREIPRSKGYMFVLLLAHSFVTSQWAQNAAQLPAQQLLLLIQLDTMLPGACPRIHLTAAEAHSSWERTADLPRYTVCA